MPKRRGFVLRVGLILFSRGKRGVHGFVLSKSMPTSLYACATIQYNEYTQSLFITIQARCTGAAQCVLIELKKKKSTQAQKLENFVKCGNFKAVSIYLNTPFIKLPHINKTSTKTLLGLKAF